MEEVVNGVFPSTTTVLIVPESSTENGIWSYMYSSNTHRRDRLVATSAGKDSKRGNVFDCICAPMALEVMAVAVRSVGKLSTRYPPITLISRFTPTLETLLVRTAV